MNSEQWIVVEALLDLFDNNRHRTACDEGGHSPLTHSRRSRFLAQTQGKSPSSPDASVPSSINGMEHSSVSFSLEDDDFHKNFDAMAA